MITRLTALGETHELPRLEWSVSATPDGPHIQGAVPTRHDPEESRDIAQAWADVLGLRETDPKNAAAVFFTRHDGTSYTVLAL